jgi:hypothetical protein
MTTRRGIPRFALTCCVVSALSLASIAADPEQKIHACKNAKGDVVYQDGPCVEPATALPKPKTAPAQKPAVVKPKAAQKSQPVIALPPAVVPSGRAVDSRWATPEKTLQTFMGALKAGDKALALSCLTASALADRGWDAASFPLETLRETVGSFTALVSEGDLGPFWSIRALRAGMRPKWIFFERTAGSEWKIAAI